MGGHLYGLGIHRNKLLNKFLLSKRLSAFLREHDYDIVHINSGALLYNLQVAAIAKRCGIKRIIVHAHSTLCKSKKRKSYGQNCQTASQFCLLQTFLLALIRQRRTCLLLRLFVIRLLL